MMVQRFVPEIAQGDKRILVIGGKPVPSSPGAHSAGQRDARQPGGRRQGRGAAADRRATARSPRRSARCWRARGLLLVGLDVIGDYLTEINVTSPTCFQEITEQTGFDVPAMFVDALEARAGR